MGTHTKPGRAYFINIDGGAAAPGVQAPGRLYSLYIPAASFTQREIGAPPAGLTGAAAAYDRSRGGIYFYGGFDGQTWHNYVHFLDLATGLWLQVSGDCPAGSCPPISSTPAAFHDAGRDVLYVIPGRAPDGTAQINLDSFFLMAKGEWTGNRESTGAPDAGDCNGDGAADQGYGMLCRSYEAWWQEPGRVGCDTFSRAAACDQKVPPAATVYDGVLAGVGSMQAVLDTLFIARGSRVSAFDASSPASPVLLDELEVGAPVREIELSSVILAVARDASIAFLGVEDPSAMSLLGEVPSCGRPVTLETTGDSVYFLTSLGIGEIDIRDVANPVLVRFSWLLPGRRGTWRLIPQDVSLCGYISRVADILCALTGCPGTADRGFDVAGGKAYLTALKSFLVLDLDESSGFAVDSTTPLSSFATALRQEGGYVYLNLKKGGGIVYDVRDPMAPTYYGGHSLTDWVNGVEYEYHRAYRLDGRKVQIAAWEE